MRKLLMVRMLAGALTVLVVSGACGGTDSGAAGGVAPSGTIRLYSSVTQDTVDAVVAAYRERNPGVTVDVFRAPTGELTARLAAEQRSGGIQADVIWLTDPLTMQQYEADGLLRAWVPEEVEAVASQFRSDRFWGTRILNMVIVFRTDLTAEPVSWIDLTDPVYGNGVAIPDPRFAGSAFGALGYFALDPTFGFDYYRALADNGVVQVRSPGDVVTGVAEGQYLAGWSLDKVARGAIEKGSPIQLVFPEPGAIAMYSPIAVFDTSGNPVTAESFVSFVLSRPAQEAIASTGWQPIRADVEWPVDGPQVAVDWRGAFHRQDELLEEYRSIFGG